MPLPVVWNKRQLSEIGDDLESEAEYLARVYAYVSQKGVTLCEMHANGAILHQGLTRLGFYLSMGQVRAIRSVCALASVPVKDLPITEGLFGRDMLHVSQVNN